MWVWPPWGRCKVEVEEMMHRRAGIDGRAWSEENGVDGRATMNYDIL